MLKRMAELLRLSVIWIFFVFSLTNAVSLNMRGQPLSRELSWALDTLNLVPFNWTMFSHHFTHVFDIQVVDPGNSQTHRLKGTHHPFRRSPVNELEEKVFNEWVRTQGTSTLALRYKPYLCRNFDGAPPIRLLLRKREIPLTTLFSFESFAPYQFITVGGMECN